MYTKQTLNKIKSTNVKKNREKKKNKMIEIHIYSNIDRFHTWFFIILWTKWKNQTKNKLFKLFKTNFTYSSLKSIVITTNISNNIRNFSLIIQRLFSYLII